MATLGEKLKAAREQAGYTTSQAAEATRMKIQRVEEIERDDFSNFAAVIYGKGFIKIYAEFLNLDPSPLITEYVEASKAAPDPTLKPAKGNRRKEPAMPTRAPAPPPPARRPAPADKGGLLFDARGEPTAGAATKPNERRAAPRSIGDMVAGVAAQMRERVEALKPAPRVPEPVVRAAPPPPTAPTPRTVTIAGTSPAAAPAAPSQAGHTPGARIGAPAQSGGPQRSVALVIGVLLILILLISGVTRCVRSIFTRGEHGRGARGDVPMVLTQDPPEPYAD